MHPFPSSCCCPTLMEVAAVSLYCGTGELFQRAPERGAGAVSPSMPPFKKSSSLPSFLGPMSQKQHGSVQRCSAVLCAGHSGAQGWCGKQGCSVGTKDQLHEEQGCSRALPLLTACQQWCSGGFCCRTVWFRGLKWCVLVSLLSAWHWGSTGHSVGFPVWRVFVPVQCPPSGLLVPSASRLLQLGHSSRGTFCGCGAVSQGWAFLQTPPSSSLPAVDTTSPSEHR